LGALLATPPNGRCKHLREFFDYLIDLTISQKFFPQEKIFRATYFLGVCHTPVHPEIRVVLVVSP
ncbi:MAG: hypothetical protein LBM07_03575, partial [Culturomica sp.]|nr:hypothetical protein [Culturomica sp.]